ncbi:centromere-associated protein E isoform X2 [Syngnathoides biaculeatus]|uniref:centromere-associated protein E isoform X2 n=1 Tax=Syngnathoides biaculeatus TaxID=300417 RepID=UPI002ADDC9EB|nr:centromere-associated protein E isoform X2 [Syngnathoides biaculeatus]
MAEESAVKVCVRVRPAIRREESHPSERTEPDQIFWKANKKLIHQLDDGNSPKSFSFDRVFTAEETTDQLYQDIAKPLVVSTVGGYNGTIFAYGQTASGKTFTMMGTNHIPGVIPMAIDDVFQTIKKCPKKEFLLRVSYMEIYNETVTDLLVDSWKRKPLEVRETTNKNIYVADLTEELVTSPAQALAWIRKGEKNRHYGMTKMNQRSSRSHTIFRMILESRERSDLSSGENADGAIIVSHLNLVDLAGSERASQTGAEGTRLKEGCNINRSLFTLGQVMMKLSDESPSGFINYRDSKLTRILQNSLGGNAKTVILCTITPTFLDETLRTLQFASTAKKMKNDPHVTEVSDDGALLKRYRNEIVDLKKRLHEVSLVTQTTATEREVLSQLLQEKEQLQGEQEDRIRNLTKLLVTSTNLSRVPKVPKRRVTWGGKIAPPSTREDVQSDLSFVCSVNQRKVSCLTEVEDEEFDSHWEIPEEALDDTNSSGDFVTLRSFGNRSFERVSELELQLQALDQENQQALAQIQAMEKEAADVDLKFKSEAQQKADATDKIKLLELSVAELNKQLEEQRSNRQSEFNKQIGRDFEETVHLCEILATEKEMLASERDYLKQELGIFMEQTQILEKENAALSQELEENRELEEFKYLEKKFGKELEWEFQDEIGSLKKVIEAQGIQCLEFKKNLETVSEELMKKTKMADDLQNMVGKDLTQEVAKLRRSLEDSEGLGRETKKEWAFLRSENIALEEMKKTLTVSHEKMEAEVHSLRFQLESEKSNFRKMQMDLQKELNDVFKENTKLTTLLDGKVPRNMMDNVELERTVINLKKELTASQEAEEVLKAQLEELRSLQSLTNEGNNLDKIAAEEMEKRESDVAVLTAERDQLRMDLQENIDMMIENQADLRNAHGKIVALKQRLKQLESSQTPNLGKPIDGMTAEIETLQTQIQKLSKDLESVVTDRDHVQSKMEKLVCQVTSLSEERNQLQNQLERAALTMKCACVQAEKNVLVAEKSSDVLEKLTFREMSLNEEHPVLQKTMEILRQEKNELAAKLKDVTATYEAEKMHFLEKIDLTEAERDALLAENENGRCLTEELEELTCKVNSASGDRAELQETLEILSQEKNELAARLEHLTGTYQAEKMHFLEKIELAEAEKDALLAENENRRRLTEELEKLTCKVNSLSGERAELQEILEILSQEKNELAVKFEDVTGTYQAEKMHLLEKIELAQAEKDALLAENENRQRLTEELEKLTCKVNSLSGERAELQEILEILSQEKNELAARLEHLTGTYQAEKMHFLEKIELAQAEKNALLPECESRWSSAEELEKLTCKVNSLSGERAQLQEILEILSQEKKELAAKLEDVTGTYQAEKMHLLEKIELAQAEKNALLAERESRLSSAEELEKLTCKVNSLSGERAQLQEILEIHSQEKKELAAKLEDVTGTYQAEKMHLLEKIELAQAEKNALLAERESRLSSAEELEKLTCKVNSLSGERAQLQEILEILSQEKKELAARLEHLTGTYQAEKMHLLEKIELAQAEKNALLAERKSRLSSAEELEKVTCKENSLSGERAQLQETLEILTEEKNQLTTKLEDMTETHEAKKVHLVELLALAEAERDALLAEKERRLSTAEELEELTHKVNSLCVERAQLQGTLEILNQEKSELSVKLEDMTGTYEAEKINLFEKVALAEAERDARLAEKENECKNSAEKLQKLTSQLMFLSGERAQMQEILEEHERDKKQIKVELQDKMSMVQQLEEQVKLLKKNQSEVQAEANTSQQLLTEAKATISVLNQKLKRSDQNMTDSKVTASSRLHDSTVQLEELFGRFQQFVDACIDSQHEVKEEQAEYFLNDKHSFPQATYIAHNMVCGLGHKNFMTLSTIIDALLKKAQLYTINFRQLVRCDLSSFEEWRLQDMLQCRSQAPTYTLKDLDCCSGRGNRLCELIQKRQFCVQKMDSILKKLRKSLDSYRNEHSADVREKARFSKQGILDDWQVEDQELRQLNAQAQRQLQEDKDKRVTLQHMLEETPSSEPSLLSNNQQRDLLRQSEENIKWKQEEEAEIKANSCVTDHSVAIQQLKMELLASQAQVGQLENTIKTLKQLQESEKSESPFSAELEKVKMELFKMKLELNAASEKHRQEIQKMTIVLNVKEESLRKLKETLRTQHQGDESFLQGEELCDRLLNPRGVVNKTSRGLRENNLEEEVKHLQIKIGHLENVISSQQADLAKWKNRAIKLKLKANRDFKSSPPHTPTKQGPCVYPDTLLQSPRKFSVVPQKLQGTPIVLQDSPKIPLIDSPKSQFFDFASNADLLARTCPTQFFDNSSLGITADTKLDENCSQPPRQDCITQ